MNTACRALVAALAAETERRRAAFPDPAVVALVAELPGASLWARGPEDDDWLVLRVGCGSAPSRTLVRDGGQDRPGGLLTAVPATIDLRAGPVGLAGPTAVRTALARWWVAQLAVHHSPDDLSVVVVSSDVSWAWVRWLPHARVVTADDERAELIQQLTAEVEHRVHRVERGGAAVGPATVLVVDGPAEPALVDLVARGVSVGLTAVWLRAEPGSLPGGCTPVVAAAGGRVRVVDSASPATDVVADTVTVAWCDQLARNLAPLVDARARAAARLPDDCSLTGLLGLVRTEAAEIARAWERSNGRADTVLGRTADGVLNVDLEADGPHALVAGTTGSGKSELLRTFVAGLCLRHPPDELTVLLVDYKGGAAFAECADLPHCAGVVTDLDPHLTARALRSLDAEIRRREELLHAAGAVDLQAYRASAPDVPLARLVIVVDEFATLAEDLPDFVTGLVGVAQRGRSLGVHLVLATQRPGSVVSPQIRANTSLRIALRVTDAADSIDVVGTDDAAAIAPSTPGRAVLRDGSGLRVFQTARPTITPSPASAPRVRRLDGWRRVDPDDEPGVHGLGALVAEVVEAARTTGRVRARRPWLPPLDDVMITPDDPGAAFAVVDLPGRQRRPQLELSLDPPSSTLLLGAARSGRTTALAALALAAARTHPGDEVEIHVVDAQGGLVDLVGSLPHLGTCLGPDDVELADTLLDRLTDATGPRRHLLLVDGWDVVLAALGDAAAAAAGQRLASLLRAPGRTTVVVSGDRSLVAPRVSGAFDHRLVLRMSDPMDYGALGLSARDLPVSFPPGRGLRAQDGAEFQVLVPRPVAGSTVADAIRAAAAELSVAASPRVGVLRIRALPASVELHDLGPAPAARLRIGLGGDDAAPVTLDLFAGSRRWLVCGPPRSGRSGVLSLALVEAVRVGCPVLVAAPSRSPLAGLATRLGVALLDPADPPDADPLRAGPPAVPTLLLVDDTDAFLDTEVGDTLLAWVRDTRARLSVLASGRPDDIALAYRGLAAEVRRSRSGIVLHPGPVDGELLGVRLPRARAGDPPGRGRLVGDPAWRVGSAVATDSAAAAIRIQVAAVPPSQPMWG